MISFNNPVNRDLVRAYQTYHVEIPKSVRVILTMAAPAEVDPVSVPILKILLLAIIGGNSGKTKTENGIYWAMIRVE